MIDALLAARSASPDAIKAALETLSPEQRAALYAAAARDSMAAYVQFLGLGITPAQHHLLLIQHLEALARGDFARLMVLLPPGAGKSTYTSALFPAWYLGRNPTLSIIAASHTQELAARFGRRVRNHFNSAEHRAVFGVGVATDSAAADRWETEKGGEYFAIGVGGAVTGRRSDISICDDPVRSREDADSDRARERTWEWYQSDFLTRLKPGGKQVLIQTRWHEADLAGRLLATEADRWRVLKLPMEAGPDDPLGRKPGERLWPEWFTEEMVADAKRDVRVWHALYQQEPAGEEGDYFKLEWFQADVAPPQKTIIYGASDYAVTEGKGDYTEHGVFAIDAWSNIHIIDWWRGQTAPDTWIEKQCDLILKHKPMCWFGEAGPIRRAVEPFLHKRMEERRAWCRIEWLPSISDKPTRCRPFQALAASNKVFVPDIAPWRTDLLGQLIRFPAGRYDDGVDVCSLLGRGIEHVRVPEFMPANRQTHAIVGYETHKRRINKPDPRAAISRSSGQWRH